MNIKFKIGDKVRLNIKQIDSILTATNSRFREWYSYNENKNGIYTISGNNTDLSGEFVYTLYEIHWYMCSEYLLPAKPYKRIIKNIIKKEN